MAILELPIQQRGTIRHTFALANSRATVTLTVASPCVVTWAAHGLVANDVVVFETNGALPTGLAVDTAYYVVGASITANTFQLSTTSGGSAINTTGIQSGTHTARNAVDLTGCDVEIAVRPIVKDHDVNAAPLLVFSTDDGTISTPGADGEINIEWDDVTDSAGTGQSDLDECGFDIKITWSDGTVTYEPQAPHEGRVIFQRNYT